MEASQAVRDYVRREYFEPAKRRNQAAVTVVAGDVHKALHLSNRVPLVCQALGGKKILEENGITLEKREGPKSGLGTRATFTYRLNRAPQKLPRQFPFVKLRGIAKEVFASLGGGEKFIMSERERFYGDRK